MRHISDCMARNAKTVDEYYLATKELGRAVPHCEYISGYMLDYFGRMHIAKNQQSEPVSRYTLQ
jgi:hypothetical protein